MNREKLIRAGIHYDEGVARFAGKAELYEKYLRRLFAGNTVETLMSQLESGDVTGAFRTAHDLKGNAGNLSVSALYRAVCELVEILRPGTAAKDDYLPAAERVLDLYEKAKQAATEAEHD